MRTINGREYLALMSKEQKEALTTVQFLTYHAEEVEEFAELKNMPMNRTEPEIIQMIKHPKLLQEWHRKNILNPDFHLV